MLTPLDGGPDPNHTTWDFPTVYVATEGQRDISCAGLLRRGSGGLLRFPIVPARRMLANHSREPLVRVSVAVQAWAHD